MPKSFVHIAPRLCSATYERLQRRQERDGLRSISRAFREELIEGLEAGGPYRPVSPPPASATRTDIYLPRPLFTRVHELAREADTDPMFMFLTILNASGAKTRAARSRALEGAEG